MLPWELRCVLGGNRSESGIIILYSASEQGYLVLALYKHALLLYFVLWQFMNPTLIESPASGITIDRRTRHLSGLLTFDRSLLGDEHFGGRFVWADYSRHYGVSHGSVAGR